jgi:hypothetical protein
MRTRFKSDAARLLFVVLLLSFASSALADELRLVDGSMVIVDEAWEDGQGIWYRRGGVTYLVERSRVREIVKASHDAGAQKKSNAKTNEPSAKNASDVTIVKTVADDAQKTSETVEVWIYLVGGARMEVDEANETTDGVWYRRDKISTFIERARVDRIERVAPETVAAASDSKGKPREWRWTTGSTRLDSIIKQNGSRYGVDPYLVFCVMEQESHFNSRAVSPSGARGLMQLMPGTSSRFGVRNPHDPAQNVNAGTRYLRELLARFNDRVDLVLAGYNAGEGNVTRYGYRVPPFRETRNYVRRITARYEEVK